MSVEAKTLLACAAIGIVSAVFGASPSAGQAYSARFGPQQSTMSHEFGRRFETLTGLRAGVGIVLRPTSPVQFLAGFEFAEKGTIIDAGDIGYRTHLRYIEAPLLMRLAGPNLSGFRPHLVLGGGVSALGHCKATAVVRWLGSGEYPSDCGAADIAASRFELTGVTGVGVSVTLTPTLRGTLDFRFGWGLASVTHLNRPAGNRWRTMTIGWEWAPG